MLKGLVKETCEHSKKYGLFFQLYKLRHTKEVTSQCSKQQQKHTQPNTQTRDCINILQSTTKYKPMKYIKPFYMI